MLTLPENTGGIVVSDSDWAVHADVTRGYGRTVFELLHKNIDASINGREPPAAEEFRYALSLLESRDSLLDFLRDHGLRQARIFDATDWALFLKHYLGVVAECPVVLEKTIQPCHHIIDVTLSGFDVPAQVAETIHPDDITLGVRWTFRFAGGLKFPFDIPLIFSHERAAPCQICASDDA